MRHHFDRFADGVAGPISASTPLSRSFRSCVLSTCGMRGSRLRKQPALAFPEPLLGLATDGAWRPATIRSSPLRFDAAITARHRRDDSPPPKSPVPMARPVVPLTRAILTAERLLFSHPTHHGCNPCQSRDGARRAAPGGDESDRFNTRSCRKRQRPFRSLFPTD